MLIRITEQDKSYVAGLRQMLLAGGAKATSDEAVLEVQDDFDRDQFHGVQVVSSALPFHVEYAPEVDWIKRYDGDFHFYISLKSQLSLKGYLSPKQVECIRRAMAKDGGKDTSETIKTADPANNPAKMAGYSLKPGDIINVSRWLAREIGQKSGLCRPHFTLEVVKVDAETDRAYKATLQLSGQRMSRCGVCGLTLTDPRSVTAGIGPICAEKAGVSFTESSLSELMENLKETRAVNTWFPKSSIKERINKG